MASSSKGTGAPLGQPVYSVKTTSGAPYTELAQPNRSVGPHGQEPHAQPEHMATDGPVATATKPPPPTAGGPAAGTQRPDAHIHGHKQEPSVASIKSGVIGFGPTEQGHAAMSMHNPTNTTMTQGQVVGGGSPGTAGMSQDRDMHPVPDAQTAHTAINHEPVATEPQPYENTLRKESYITDTDRSFPLAGGVISTPHEAPAHENHGRQGLAGAAAAATAMGASHAIPRSEERHVQEVGLETRQATYGHVPPNTVQDSTTNTATDISSHPSSDHDSGAFAAAAAVASGSSAVPTYSQEQEVEADDIETLLPTTEPTASCERPMNPRLESRHRHIPGEYIATPSDESAMFMIDQSAMEPAGSREGGDAPVQSPLSTEPPASSAPSMDPAPVTVSHELRHTGTLQEPRPRSADSSNTARDAAIAGGLAAGAAGLGIHAASENRGIQDVQGDQFLYEDASPYSSKTLDPRVLGATPKLEEQRFDPEAKADHDIDSAMSRPPVSHDSPSQTAPTNVAPAGYGAQDAVDAYGNHRMTRLGASMPEQRYDPAASSAHAPNPIAPKSQYDYNNHNTLGNMNRTDPNDHVNRNAFMGAGLAGAALGAGAYAREPHAHDSQNWPLQQKEDYAAHPQGGPVLQPAYPLQDTSTHSPSPIQGTIAPHNTHAEDHSAQTDGAAQDPVGDKHDTLAAPVLGGAVGAAGLGGATHMNNRNGHEREKEQHHHDKDSDKEETEEKKKHRLLGFLHRDKSKKERSSASPEHSPRQSKDYSPRHSKDYSDDAESPRWKGKHRLHKDPPKGHPAREAMQQPHESEPYAVGKRQHMGFDGPIGDANAISGDRETRHGVHGAHPTTDLDHDPTVIEPHTGLRMNAEQFGAGAGSTDGNPAIRGHHAH
ncbi:hypothetical protein ACJBU6_04409 [Exserohilum turcicum]